MTESMGQIIKRLRKERNFTQEELAERLNVTAQAVSKWENESGMPDISQIVPICNVFGIQADVLFGRLGQNCDAEVDNIIGKTYEIYYEWLNSDNGFRDYLDTVVKCYESIKSALCTYPSSFKLNARLAVWGYHLISERNEPYIKQKFTADELDAIKNECIRSCEFILKNTNDIGEIIDASSQLIGIYNALEEFGKSEELLAYLPESLASWRGTARISARALLRHEALRGRYEGQIVSSADIGLPKPVRRKIKRISAVSKAA